MIVCQNNLHIKYVPYFGDFNSFDNLMIFSFVGRMKTMHFKYLSRSFDRPESILSNKYTSFCSISV